MTNGRQCAPGAERTTALSLDLTGKVVTMLNCGVENLLEVVEDLIADFNLTDPNTACHQLVFASIVLMHDA